MNFEQRLEHAKRRIVNDARFRDLFQRMRAAFEDGQADPEDIREALFVYENIERFEIEEAEARAARKGGE